MREQVSLDQRVATLEDEVAALKKRVDEAVSIKGKSWIDKISGSMKDFPEFDEVARLGAEIRRADTANEDVKVGTRCSS